MCVSSLCLCLCVCVCTYITLSFTLASSCMSMRAKYNEGITYWDTGLGSDWDATSQATTLNTDYYTHKYNVPEQLHVLKMPGRVGTWCANSIAKCLWYKTTELSMGRFRINTMFYFFKIQAIFGASFTFDFHDYDIYTVHIWTILTIWLHLQLMRGLHDLPTLSLKSYTVHVHSTNK